MNRIIVTIRIKQKKEYDLELPVHQKIKDLMQDISDSLEGLDPLAWFDPEKGEFSESFLSKNEKFTAISPFGHDAAIIFSENRIN